MNTYITPAHTAAFLERMRIENKSENTIRQYARDMDKLSAYLAGRPLTGERLSAYRGWLLGQGHRPRSVNAYLSVANRFCEVMGWEFGKEPAMRLEKGGVADAGRLTSEEYRRLVQAAVEHGTDGMALLVQLFANTGLRLNELPQLTVDAVRRGIVRLPRKGGTVTLVLGKEYVQGLEAYIKRHGIIGGMVFCTAHGNPPDRSNIWRELKQLCRIAGIEESRVSVRSLKQPFEMEFIGES